MQNVETYLFPIVVNIVRYFILAGIPFLIVYILFPRFFSLGKIQKQWAKNTDFFREIRFSLQSMLVLVGVGLIVLNSPLRDYTQFYSDSEVYPSWWMPVSVIIALFAHDTYFYWMHRTIHHKSLYKHIHLAHHKSINPSPWAAYAFHVFEAFLEALIVPIVLLILPMNLQAIIWFTTASFVVNVYGHLGFEIAPKWFRKSFLFEIMNTSTHHNLHHSKFKGNYGLYFRVWDRLMKTENPDYVKVYDEIQARRFG